MTDWALAYVRRHSFAASRGWDYIALAKPRIAVLVLLTVAAGAWLAAWGSADPLVVLHALLGTALVAASGSALNQWFERHSDARMRRTAGRPLPAGRLSAFEVLCFAALTAVVGVAYLVVAINWRTGAIALATWFLYGLVYTPLKPRSIYNTAVGAVAGAMPVLIGWAAANGRFNLLAGSLFMIVYLWQFPHFMAIAWMYRDEYQAAGLRMLPSVDPRGFRTSVQAVSAALALLPVSLVPALSYSQAPWYTFVALALGACYVLAAMLFFVRKDQASARLLLRISLIYLPTLLGALVLLPLA
jgi:protoheme IX farnesyltransferase